MTLASGEKDPVGCWGEPRSGPRSENVRVYRSWNRLFGDLGANGVGTLVGRTSRELGRSAPRTQTASGRRSVLALVGRILGSKQRQHLGRSDPWTRTASERWSGFFSDTALVKTASRTASGPWSFGSADANGVGVSTTAWVNRRQDVDRSASGCRSGWGALFEHGVGTSVGFRLEIVWVERRQDVGLAIVWRQRRGSIGSGLWWSDTAWVSQLEPR